MNPFSRRFGPDSPGFPAALSALLLVSLWMDAFLPSSGGGGAMPAASPLELGWLLGAALKNAARAAIVLFAMRATGGFAAYGFTEGCLVPEKGNAKGAFLVAASLLAASAAMALIFRPQGSANPGSGTVTAAFLGAAALSALAAGYAEELFFRCFAQSALIRAGIAGSGAVLIMALTFGLAHGSQGMAGMVTAALLGGMLGAFRLSGRGPHALALGHAIYDFAVLVLAASPR